MDRHSLFRAVVPLAGTCCCWFSVAVPAIAAPTPNSIENSADNSMLNGVDTSSGAPLFKKWSDQLGEDLGTPSASSPLVEIEGDMRAAQGLIDKGDTAGRTEKVQQQVITRLDALIQELKKQCSACQGQRAPGEQPSRRSQPQDAKPGKAAGGKGTTAAEESTARVTEGAAQEAEMGQVQELLKDVWGNLPSRARERLLQSPTDAFLPKYELEIEKYFRRLAEEGQPDDRRP